MNRVNRKWCDWSYKCCNSTIFGSPISSIRSICNWLSISCPFLIINHNLSFHLIFTLLKFIKWSYHYGLGSYITKLNIQYPGILLPKPIKSSFCGVGRGEYKVKDSLPRTHLVKFLTGSSLMFANPSFFAIVAISDITI